MTVAAALLSNPTAGRIPNAATGKPGVEAANAAEGGLESFATVLAGTAQTAEAAAVGAAPATNVTTSASTQISKLIAAATGDAETIPAETAAEGVVADPSQVVPVAATQAAIVTAVTTSTPNLTGTAVVVDAEAGDASIPADGEVEGAALVPVTAPATAGVPAAAANVANQTTASQAAAVATEATAAIPTAETAANVETDATVETTDAVDGDNAATTASASSQTPAKASATGLTASPASATPPNAATNVAAATPDLQAAVDPTAGAQAKTTTTIDALAAAAPAPHEAARASATNTAAQASAPAATVQVYTRMIERFDGRAQRFEIRLDPAELGRVDVRIEIGADKKVHAVLAAHDSAALNDLMRGHRALERALADAGIDMADGGVKFELASDSNRNPSNGETKNGSPTAPNVWRSFDIPTPSAEAAAKPVAQPWRQSRLDLVA